MHLPPLSPSTSFNSENHLQLSTPYQNWTCGNGCLWHCPTPFWTWALGQTKAMETFPKAHLWCKSISQCSSFHAHVFSRETMMVNIKKYRSRRCSMVATLAPAGRISWKHTALHGSSCAYQKLVPEDHADQFKSRSSKYHFHCKGKHLEGPNSLGTKPNAHVLLMCIFSATLETDTNFQLISTSDMHWEIYSVFWDL